MLRSIWGLQMWTVINVLAVQIMSVNIVSFCYILNLFCIYCEIFKILVSLSILGHRIVFVYEKYRSTGTLICPTSNYKIMITLQLGLLII